MKHRLIFLLASAMIPIFGDTKEIVDPASYSAGTKTEKEINEFFRKNIREENYNLWFGKKEIIPLTGAWKIRLLANSEKNTKGIIRSNIGLSADGVESNYGEKNGFFKKEFDDSKWFSTPVPFVWTQRFQAKGNLKHGNPYSENDFLLHEGWYRRNFEFPNVQKNERILIHFKGIAYKADLYLNGQKIGSYENSRPNHLWIGAGRTEERFHFDITETLKQGKNVLAVKVFSPYRSGGIWQEVFLEKLPSLYADKILVTPNLKKSSIELRAFLVNSTGKTAKIIPEFEWKPWKSHRCQTFDFPKETGILSEMELKPGTNELFFSIPIKNPKKWSPEQPVLYHLLLKNGKTVLGQERFGFRTFEIGTKNFLFNGIPRFLMGENMGGFGWCFPGNNLINAGFGILNKDRAMEQMIRNYKNCGYNIFRSNGNYPSDLFFDIADEIGLMIADDDNPDIRKIEMKNGRAILNGQIKESIRKRCFSAYNHPSLVFRTGRNEAFEKQLIDTPFEKYGWTPILNSLYEEYKKWDCSRPMASSSGRGWKGGEKIYHSTYETAKGDFDIPHPYGTNRSLKNAETDHNPQSYRNFKKNYTQEHGGKERLMYIGEGSEFYTFSPFSGGGRRVHMARVKDFTPHLKNGMFNRKFLAEKLNMLDPVYLSEACEFSLIPLSDSIDTTECFRIQAWHNRQIMEQFRRLRKDFSGYILHMPGIFKDFSFGHYQPQTFQAAQMAQQPVLPCVSGFFPRNIIAGKPVQSELYLINDSPETLPESAVAVYTKDGLKLTEFLFPPLPPAGIQKQPISIPTSGLSDGDGTLILQASANGKILGRNEVEIFVLNEKNIVLSKKKRMPFLVLKKNPALEEILKQLKLEYSIADTIPEKHALLLVHPKSGSIDAKHLEKFLQSGGRAVFLEQEELPETLHVRDSGSGFADWTELVKKDHPLFSGLKQDHFRYWNGKENDGTSVNLFSKALIPLNEGVLAMSMTFNYRMGMSVAEYRIGKGYVLISQLKALDRFGKDSIATKYLMNLLDYAGCGTLYSDIPVIEKKLASIRYRVNPENIFPVDLRPYTNMGFRDDAAHDKKGGWSDHGPQHDARMLPAGKQTFAGIPFTVIDPKENNGKSCLVLQGGRLTETEFLPRKIENIRIGTRASRLYFLMTSKYTPKKGKFGMLRIKMNVGKSGGTSAFYTIPLNGFENLGDWWNVKEVPNAKIGWKHLIPGQNIEVGLYVLLWNNPEPQVEIESVDFISDGTGIPILLGISGEKEASPESPAVPIRNHSALLNGKNWSVKIHKNYPLATDGKTQFLFSAQKTSQNKTFERIGKNKIRWTSTSTENQAKELCRQEVVYEMIPEKPELRIRSRVYLEESGGKGAARQVLSLGASAASELKTENGKISFHTPWLKIKNAGNIFLYTGPDQKIYKITVSGTMDAPNRSLFTNFGISDYEKNKKHAGWFFMTEKTPDGKALEPGEYSEMEITIHPAENPD